MYSRDEMSYLINFEQISVFDLVTSAIPKNQEIWKLNRII